MALNLHDQYGTILSWNYSEKKLDLIALLYPHPIKFSDKNKDLRIE
jgi:hypothetical protein